MNLTEFPTPHLDATARARLIEALEAAHAGDTVRLAVEYHKVTSTPERVPGADYQPRLAHGPEVIEGAVHDVAVGKHGFYVVLDASVTRQPVDGTGEPDEGRRGWASIKGEGIHELLGAEIKQRTAQVPPA